jgi:hypothetical protein
VDDTSFNDVIKLYKEMRTMQIGTKKIQDPNRVIRVRAGDDWF